MTKMFKFMVFIFFIDCYIILGQNTYDSSFYGQRYPGMPTKEIVDVQVFYESLCPGCRQEFKQQLVPLVSRLSSYINLNLYPYGKATTYFKNGHYEFESQHGPLETYGNKLHSCAINMLPNTTSTVLFNSCMMDDSWGKGSDDHAADMCGRYLLINSEAIKQCARRDLGSVLLKQNGDITKPLSLKSVPSVFVNGKLAQNRENLFAEVCAAFNNPPPACRTY